VNKYPGQRTFTAIGTGGDDFKATMLAAVEGVVGSVHVECVSQRPSSGGKYLSVRIGPVWVQDADQVSQQQQQQQLCGSSSSNCAAVVVLSKT
jgi:putative lipoic acid-binding regulatory protein